MIHRLNVCIDIVMVAVSLFYQENFDQLSLISIPDTNQLESVIMNASAERKLDKICGTTSGKC